jgi:TonB family protein
MNVLDQRPILPPSDPVPRASIFVLSALAHVGVLLVASVFWRPAKIRILPVKFKTVEIVSGVAHLSFHPTRANSAPRVSPFHAQRSLRRPRATEPGTADGAALKALRRQAKEATAGIMLSLRFRQIYGFTPTHDFQLPVRTAGEVPAISADGVPPRFEQYVVVEVTIDVDGRVAEARIVTGVVDSPIEQKLLSAIREFKYNPAKRDGVPIPSQLDIVIHIPS